MEKVINLPLTDAVIEELHAGDKVLLCGEMLVMRDAAHKRLYDAIKQGDSLPFSVENETVYYMGPSPARQGKI
ncbi:MAG: fumarate hydratase C-terminal domain-containing protein, partial [Clostridia bacterium]|nr:fumarate hydratase C-terminal domain-containing protein [Clostridia bacterium]